MGKSLLSQLSRVADRLRGRSALTARFAGIYRDNGWECEESRSGPGSTLEYTENLRHELRRLLRSLDVRSMIDVPCGDWSWMSEVDLGGIDYLGLDIVPELIAENERRHGANGRRFGVLDLTSEPLPRADLVMCRDCLMHLSESMVHRALQNIAASGARYALITSYPGGRNEGIKPGKWFPIDLTAAPYGLSEPLEAIDDFVEGFPERKMLLWDAASLAKPPGSRVAGAA